jgi:hypothetical protein
VFKHCLEFQRRLSDSLPDFVILLGWTEAKAPPSFISNKFTTNLFGIMGGEVQLGPLSTAATNRHIVPAPGDYDDGEIGGMIGRGNRSTQENLPQCRFVHHKPHMLTGRKPGLPQWEASD